MRKAEIVKHTLIFKTPGGTSRGVLHEKPAWFIILREDEKTGVGECSLLPKLSLDDRPDFESRLREICRAWESGAEMGQLNEHPSIRFGMETALRSLSSYSPFMLYPSPFTRGAEKIEINGLVWMGSKLEMQSRIREKLNSGFHCIKLKIGAIDFEAEMNLLKAIRREYDSSEIEIRVDANGAFSPENALEKLSRLAELDLHSIEQPIKQGQWEEMARLCAASPIDIALDEELIAITERDKKMEMLRTIKPQAIVIKPGLVGGIASTKEWIEAAQKTDSYFWLTSALESNVGLNAIAQFTATLQPELPQGLGTGSLYTNNIESPLEVEGKYLTYKPEKRWEFPYL